MKKLFDLLRGLFKIVEYNDLQITWGSTSNPYCAFTKDVSLSGYTPIAFGYVIVGSLASFVYPAAKIISGSGTLSLFLRMNNTPSSVTQNTLNLRIVYVRSGFIGGGVLHSIKSLRHLFVCEEVVA